MNTQRIEAVEADKSPVSLLGLGSMGQALAAALLDHGYPLTVWNRTAAKAAPFAAKGAVVAADPASAVAAGGPVLVCLLDYASVEERLADVDVAGRVIINLTNGTPEQARALAKQLTDRGARYLDGGIMATPPLIGTPHGFLLCGGPQELLDAQHALLSVLAPVNYCGADYGAAALQDVALLSAMYGMFSGITHAFALTASGGVSAKEFAGRLSAWLTPMAALIPDFAEQLETGDCESGVTSTLTMQVDAYRNLVATAQEQGVSAELITPYQQLMERTVADGFGQSDVMRTVSMLART